MPAPTCMVRLLATREGEVFTVPRADGNGLDIPTRRVGSAAPEKCVETLLVSALGRVHPTVFLGYVRNVVNESTDDYEWPVPDAYFAVWHCDLPADCEVAEGHWLGAREAKRRLGDRHWWPLAATVMGGSSSAATLVGDVT